MGRAGVEVYALADGGQPSLVRHSREAAGVLTVDDPKTAAVSWLEWLRAGPVGAVVLPCSDAGVEFLALHREELSGLGYRPTEANDEVSLAMLDKSRTYELAEKMGLAVPKTLTVRSPEDVEEGAASFAFPCALKPLRSHRAVHVLGFKAAVIRDADELRRTSERFFSQDVEAMITEIVPGPEGAYCSAYLYLDDDGSVLAQLTKRKPRQHPFGFGCGTFHETAWEPDAADASLHLLRSVGYRGLGVVEFKRDARDGRLKLIECNPRLTAATELVRAAGVDFARLAYERSLGRSGPRFGDFRSGVREWFPPGDLRAFLALRRKGQLSFPGWLATLAPPFHLPIFDTRDPMPSVANALRRGRTSLERIRLPVQPADRG